MKMGAIRLLNEYTVATLDYYIQCLLQPQWPSAMSRFPLRVRGAGCIVQGPGWTWRKTQLARGASELPQVVGTTFPCNVKVEEANFD